VSAKVKTHSNDEVKKPVARKDLSKAAWTWKEMKKNWVAYAMLAPYYIVFLLFTIVPVIVSLVLSFFEFNMIEPPVWVGIQNYTRLFLADDLFVTACKNTLIFASIIGPVSYIMSFCVAWFINELGPKLRAVVTLIFYAPNIGGSVYLIWKTLFSSDSYGYVNGILLDLGIITKAISFFEDAKYIMPLCIVVALWLSLGTSFLNFIAGLQGVDHSLYEAGAVDGISNRWQELWYITLPYMKPQLLLSAVLAITQAFGFGQVVNDLCGNPSTDYAAWTIMHHLDDYGGARFEIGYASAIATVLFIVMVGTNQLVKKLLSKVGQ